MMASSSSSVAPMLYELQPEVDVASVPECKDPNLLSCVKVKIVETSLGLPRVTVINKAGEKFVMDKKEGTEQTTGAYQSVSYENSDGGYRTMTLTWTSNRTTGAKQVSASINLPGLKHLAVANCAGDCHVLTERDTKDMLPD